VDLSFGYGVAYIVSVPLLLALSLRGMGTPGEWVTPALALAVSIPHYGATLLRVYQREEDRRKYAVFTVWLTLLVAASFGAALWVPIVGSVLVTAYVTWSPWHFSGQNYGLMLMYLRRAGHDPTTIKRPLYLSFVLSAGLAILAMHMAFGSGAFAPRAYDVTNTYSMLRLGIPLNVTLALAVAGGLGWVACIAVVLSRIGGGLGRVDLAPVGCLMGMQALWYLPSLGTALGWWNPGLAGFAFTAIWIAVAHAAQYLWVTYYYARREGRHRSLVSFYVMALLAGCVILTPMLFLAPGLLGGALPGVAGIGVLTISVLNIHHFILDGAIWKLRDGRVARVLLRSEEAATPEPIEPEPRWRLRPVRFAVYAVAAVSLLAQIDLVRLFVTATRERIEAPVLLRTASTLRWYGQDTPALWARTGKALEEAGQDRRALGAYRRSIGFGNPKPWVASRAAVLLLEGPAREHPGALEEAHRLADYLVARLGTSRPEGYQTLAVVHAQAGRWDEAAEAAERGLTVAETVGDLEAEAQLRRDLRRYRRRSAAAGARGITALEARPAAPEASAY
jgi:hypothetical protein